MYDPTTPSAATRPSFFLADARPRSRRISIARSSMPSDSVRAFLQSIIPAPVFSRSALIAAAFISAMIPYLSLFSDTDFRLSITARIRHRLKSVPHHENAQPGGYPAFEAALADELKLR